MKNNTINVSTLTQHLTSYSKLLADYLTSRHPAKGPFYISEWLNGIHTEILHGLIERIEQIIDGETVTKNAALDLIMLCDAALVAEGRRTTMPKKSKGVVKIILQLQVIASTIAIAKHGFIKIHGNPPIFEAA